MDIKKGIVSIIIVNYNTKDLLRNCLLSLKEFNYEIIVIDNASTDGSISMVKCEFPKITLLENKENLGFGKANNQGMRIAGGKYIMLLNSDTIVKPTAINKMVEFMEKHPDIGLLGPRLLNDDSSIQPSVSTFPNLWYVFLRMFRLRQLKRIFPSKLFKNIAISGILGYTIKSYFQSEEDNPLEVDFVSGACMLIRKEVIEKVRMFDENFFMYVEDLDFCKRIKKAGWEICYYPLAEVIHLGGKSSGGTFRDYSPVSYQSLYYYFRKHHGRTYEFMVRFIVVTALLLNVLILSLLYLLTRKKEIKKNLISYLEIIRISFEKYGIFEK